VTEALAPIAFAAAVEGALDAAVVERILTHMGYSVGAIHGRRGLSHVLTRLPAFNAAAQHSPWIVTFDLDRHTCAPTRLAEVLPRQSRFMSCRIAVRSVEAWLLADHERLGSFLRVRATRIPPDPDGLPSPKTTIVDLARQSSSRLIRAEMVARPGSGILTGPAYSSRLIQFVGDAANGWRPEIAARRSDSLRRCLEDVDRCANRYAAATAP
jgi:hypothetical protein